MRSSSGSGWTRRGGRSKRARQVRCWRRRRGTGSITRGASPSPTPAPSGHPPPPPCGRPAPAPATPILLRALAPAAPRDAARARRATDDLAIALCRARDLVLLSPEPGAPPDPRRTLRLEGRVEADCVVLSLVQPARGVVLQTLRESLVPRAGRGWADRVAGALSAAIAAGHLEQARRTPWRRADAESLVARARPAALTQEPALIGVALDMLEEALHRDPTQARAHALSGWCRAVGANHCFTRDAAGERGRASEHCRRALALAPDDPEVLTLAAGVMSLTRRIDEAEGLVTRSLALDPNQPEALRRLGFLQNFRGNGRLTAAFRRALGAYPDGNDGAMSLIGLGIANFILADYPRSARALARALDRQSPPAPGRTASWWPPRRTPARTRRRGVRWRPSGASSRT